MATILVVDDDHDIRMMLVEALHLAGHETVAAADADEALQKVKRRRFDLVLLDIMMPGRSGYDFLSDLREMPSRADTPVIVLTAYHDPVGVMREANLGAADHLAKPFLPSELEHAVERALGPQEAREERRELLMRDAEVYGSMNRLYQMVREAEPAGRKH